MNLKPYKITSTTKMDQVYLAQTDTTVGFLSQNAQKLATIKERPNDKPFIKSFDSLERYIEMGGRVPTSFKRHLRRAKNQTFVINNQAIRIVSEGEHHEFLQKFGWCYSTSANEKSMPYLSDFAFKSVDVIVEDSRALFEGDASTITKINAKKLQQLR